MASTLGICQLLPPLAVLANTIDNGSGGYPMTPGAPPDLPLYAHHSDTETLSIINVTA